MKATKITAIFTVALVLIVATALSGCTSSGSGTWAGTDSLKAGLPETMDYSIEIIGGTTSPVTVTYADLKAMEFKALDGETTVNSVGTVTTGDYVGVPMTTILAKAGVLEGEVSYKVSASDGYNIVYTEEQMDRSLLAFKKNGTALTNDVNSNNKAIRMVVPNETNSMWMKMPAKIEIIKGAAVTPVLSITGMTDNKKYYSLDDLKAMPQVNGSFLDKKSNSTLEVTGVAMNPLLDSASIQIGATAVVFADNSGYNKSVNLADIRADKTAMIAINSDGTLRSYGENLSSGAWVRNLTYMKIV